MQKHVSSESSLITVIDADSAEKYTNCTYHNFILMHQSKKSIRKTEDISLWQQNTTDAVKEKRQTESNTENDTMIWDTNTSGAQRLQWRSRQLWPFWLQETHECDDGKRLEVAGFIMNELQCAIQWKKNVNQVELGNMAKILTNSRLYFFF